MSLKNHQNPHHFLQILLLVQFFQTMHQFQLSKIFKIYPIFGRTFSICRNWFGEFAICVILLSRFVMLWRGLVLLLYTSFYDLKIALDEICRYQKYIIRIDRIITGSLTYKMTSSWDVTLP